MPGPPPALTKPADLPAVASARGTWLTLVAMTVASSMILRDRWRLVFLINVPLAVVAIALTLAGTPALPPAVSEQRRHPLGAA